MKNNFWLKIKKTILALAPMAGITDSAFRQVCRENGADVVYSEMASATALFFKPQKTLALLRFKKTERPYVVQLFGKEPAHFAKAAKIISEKIKPDGLDINFGCPARKVFGHGSGCALMPQKSLAREIISAVCENTNLPVSLKIRSGLKEINALEFIKNTHDLPYSAVMIHGRTYEGGFSGPVDFSLIEKIKKKFPQKIILANGGINSAEEAIKILKDYPLLDGLGIARGAWGKPWIFSDIKEKLKCHCEEPKATRQSRDCFALLAMTENKIKKIMLRHAKLIYADKGKLGIFEIRKHLAWYVRGWPGARELRKKLVIIRNLKELKDILDNFCA